MSQDRINQAEENMKVVERIRSRFPNITFPEPVLEPIFIGRLARKPVEGRYAVVDKNNDEVFALCTDQYKLIRHEEMLDSISETLDGIKEFGTPNVGISIFGGKMVVDLTWKGKNKKEVRKGDYVAPRIRLKNSYDLGWRMEYSFGAEQLVCTNGMTAMQVLSARSRRHLSSLRPEVFANEIGDSLNSFQEQISIWQSWADLKMTSIQTAEVIDSLPFSDAEMKKVLELGITGIPETLSLNAMFEKQKPVTLWDVHSASTQFLTHEVKSQLRRVEDEPLLEEAFTRYYTEAVH